MSETKLVLEPLAMLIPNSNFVYQKSRLRRQKTISRQEFKEKFTSCTIKVSFTDDVNDWVETKAWGHGLDCWYLVQGGFVDEHESQYRPGYPQSDNGNWILDKQFGFCQVCQEV